MNSRNDLTNIPSVWKVILRKNNKIADILVITEKPKISKICVTDCNTHKRRDGLEKPKTKVFIFLVLSESVKLVVWYGIYEFMNIYPNRLTSPLSLLLTNNSLLFDRKYLELALLTMDYWDTWIKMLRRIDVQFQ